MYVVIYYHAANTCASSSAIPDSAVIAHYKSMQGAFAVGWKRQFHASSGKTPSSPTAPRINRGLTAFSAVNCPAIENTTAVFTSAWKSAIPKTSCLLIVHLLQMSSPTALVAKRSFRTCPVAREIVARLQSLTVTRSAGECYHVAIFARRSATTELAALVSR